MSFYLSCFSVFIVFNCFYSLFRMKCFCCVAFFTRFWWPVQHPDEKLIINTFILILIILIVVVMYLFICNFKKLSTITAIRKSRTHEKDKWSKTFLVFFTLLELFWTDAVMQLVNLALVWNAIASYPVRSFESYNWEAFCCVYAQDAS